MNKSVIFKIIILFLIILNLISFKIIKNNNPKEVIEADLCFYEDNNNYILVEKNEIAKSFTSYLYKDENDNYLSKIYNYNTNEEMNLTDLIKTDKVEEYNNKINYLLELKYPKFIVDVLKKEDIKKSYIFRDNELVIYFNDYKIEPEVKETLFLKVNYNEIKEDLNFDIILENNYENESGYNYTNAKKAVAFTFDDSPNKDKTNNLLNILKDNLAHATFFIVGEKAINNKDILISIKNGGNEIGSHTYNHKNMYKLKDEEVIEDYNKMNEIYKNIFKEDLEYLRPPYGNIKDSQINLLNTKIILWSLDTNDWRYRDSNYLVNYVEENIKDGDIILFHDSYETTITAVEKLLPILYSKGYQVMSVSELFKLKGKDLANKERYFNAY